MMIKITPKGRDWDVDSLARRLTDILVGGSHKVFPHQQFKNSRDLGGLNDYWLYPGNVRALPEGTWVLDFRYGVPPGFVEFISDRIGVCELI